MDQRSRLPTVQQLSRVFRFLVREAGIKVHGAKVDRSVLQKLCERLPVSKWSRPWQMTKLIPEL